MWRIEGVCLVHATAAATRLDIAPPSSVHLVDDRLDGPAARQLLADYWKRNRRPDSRQPAPTNRLYRAHTVHILVNSRSIRPIVVTRHDLAIGAL
jgi:hypothetical protein